MGDRHSDAGTGATLILIRTVRLASNPNLIIDPWLPAGWATLLFVLSSIPGNQYPDIQIPQTDKFAHFCMYFPFGLLLGRYFAPMGELRALALLAGCFYAASDELHQVFVPNRNCSLFDWVVDVFALAAGLVAWRVIRSVALANRKRELH